MKPQCLQQPQPQLLHGLGSIAAHSCTRVALEAGVVELLLQQAYQHVVPRVLATDDIATKGAASSCQTLGVVPQLSTMMLCPDGPTAILRNKKTLPCCNNYLLHHCNVCLGA